MSHIDSAYLIIGLGQTGVATVALIQAQRQQIYHDQDTAPEFIGVGFAEAPPTLPAETYIRLSTNVEPLLQRLGQEDAPHIRPWFDLEHWRQEQPRFRLLPRPLERLVWVMEMGRGDLSPLSQLWRKQLSRLREKSASIRVFLIADLGELAGSSLIPDAVFLTRSLAAELGNTNLTLWGCTLLPDPDADRETAMRAFAALRELSRFMLAQDTQFGYPFYYRPVRYRTPRHDLWHGALKSRLFDHWYCFDRTGDTDPAQTIAGVINAYTGEAMADEALSRVVNVGGQTKAGQLLVGTANVRSLCLPVSLFQRHWAQTLAERALQSFLPAVENEIVRQKTTAFWRSFPGENSLEQTFIAAGAAAGLNRPLGALVAQLDEGFFPISTVLPAAFREDMVSLRLDHFLRPDQVDKHLAVQGLEELRYQVRQFGPPAHWQTQIPKVAYTSLFDLGGERHIQSFGDKLRVTLATLLDPDVSDHYGLPLAVQCAASWLADIRRAQKQLAPLSQLAAEQRSKRQANFDRFGKLETQLAALTQRKTGLLDARNVRQQIRVTLEQTQKAANLYLDGLRLEASVNQLQTVLAAFANEAEAQYTALARWQQTLVDWTDDLRAPLAQALPTALLANDQSIVADFDDHWLLERYIQCVDNAGGEARLFRRFTWEWDKNRRPVLALDQESIPSDRSLDWLVSRLEAVFAATRHALTILDYLQTCQHEAQVEELARYLLAAQNPALRLAERLDSARSAYGRLLLPDSTNSWQGDLVNRLLEQIETGHGLGYDSAPMLQRQRHDSPQQITYLYTLERLDLQTEVAGYTELEQAYRDHPDQQADYHVFAAEITAAHLEQRLARPLFLQAVHLLHHPARLYYFWLAYHLPLITLERFTSPSGYYFSYQIVLEGNPWLLNHPMTEKEALLPEALNFFLFNQRIHTDGSVGEAPWSPEEVDRRIELIFRAAVQAQIKTGFDNICDAQHRRWLKNARKVTTPTAIKEKVTALVSEWAWLDQAIQSLRSTEHPFAEDLLHQDLYAIGALLLAEQTAILRDEINRIFSYLL